MSHQLKLNKQNGKMYCLEVILYKQTIEDRHKVKANTFIVPLKLQKAAL